MDSNKTRTSLVIALAVLALLAGVAGARTLWQGRAPSGGAATHAAPPTAAENYEAAIASERPVVVFFHSNTCGPCVELTETMSKVAPDFQDRVEIVDVLVDSPGAGEVARRHPFQYIPTTVFLTADGEVAEQVTGPMSEDQLRERLEGIAK